MTAALASTVRVADPVVECIDVRKSFGRAVALAGVDLRVGVGRVHGLLGPNGAGKTTLLRMLFGLVQPDHGSVRVLDSTPGLGAGRSLDGIAGFVESPRFHPYLSALRTLNLLAALDGGDAPERAATALATVGLESLARRKVGGFSTGQRQRLGIAGALLRNPRVLVVDEPTTGLDPGAIADLHDLIADLAGDGRTVILSSHDMSEVEQLCDDVTILDHGKVVLDGTVAELRRDARAVAHRLRTNDDRAAADIAARCNGIEVRRNERGGLVVVGRQHDLDRMVLALAAAEIPVRELIATESALETEFRRLVFT